jgi:hypothetical protein
VTVLFFGYARQGAVVIPVVALLASLAAERWVLARVARPGGSRVPRFAIAVLLVGVGLEAARFFAKPGVSIDGRTAGATDPFPADDHRYRRIEVR